ncbi:MAG: glycosyltransferase family 4 protein [Burkholderiales bacterium]|nr:glycosyltransferase family 4 protein [Burkholderiales bacterium]
MTLPGLLILLVLGCAATWALTSSVRRYALHSDLVDRPNERSSHTVPTPRGGGIAIVVSYLALVAVFAFREPGAERLAAALLGGGGLVALLGFIDDRRPLPARWRFAGHLLAAAWVIAWFGPLPPAPIFGPVIDLGPGAYFVSGLYLVWSINQFNFMDGIDGIASLEAIAVALGGAFLWWLTQPQGGWQLAVAFAACVAGFLVWNFPKARIFMGDAGSGFLGYVVATLALWSCSTLPHLFWSWIILGGAFMVDSTVTLVRRVALGERFNQAHRSHAYQYAARRYGSHPFVSIAFFAVTALWLLPLATLVALGRLDGAWGVVIAYTPLMILAFHYKAGNRAAQEI